MTINIKQVSVGFGWTDKGALQLNRSYVITDEGHVVDLHMLNDEVMELVTDALQEWAKFFGK